MVVYLLTTVTCLVTVAVYPTVYLVITLIARAVYPAVYPHVKHAIVAGFGGDGAPLGTLADCFGS